jgi:hypothetical protein
MIAVVATQSSWTNVVPGHRYRKRKARPLVEFSLEARGDSTRLRLVESGLEKIARSDEDKETYFAEHTSGWTRIAERLRDYAPKQRSIVAG